MRPAGQRGDLLAENLIGLTLGVILLVGAAGSGALALANRPDATRASTGIINAFIAKAREDARGNYGASVSVQYNSTTNTSTLVETTGNMASAGATLGTVLASTAISGNVALTGTPSSSLGIFFDNAGTLAATSTWDGRTTPGTPACAQSLSLTLTEPNYTSTLTYPCE
jgi:hypothetical protein